MQRIDHPSNIPLASGIPAVEATVSPGYFRRPSALLGNQGTVVTADFLNDIQENLANVVTQGGESLSKGQGLNLFNAIASLIDTDVAAETTQRNSAISTHLAVNASETTGGHVEIASAAEALALFNTVRVLTPHNLTDTFETGTNALGSWCYFPTARRSNSRLIVQWADKSFTSAITVTLPKAMSNTGYHVSGTMSAPSQIQNPSISRSTTSFNYQASGYTGTVSWLVLGFSS